MRKNIFIFLIIAIPLSILGYFRLFIPFEFISTPDIQIKNNFIKKQPDSAALICINEKNITKIITSKISKSKDKIFVNEKCPQDYEQAFIVDSGINIKKPQTTFWYKNDKFDSSKNFNMDGYLYRISNTIEWKIYPDKKEGTFSVYLIQGAEKQLLDSSKIYNKEDMPKVKLLWCGDLDGDDKLDLLVKTDLKKLDLYLSSKAENYDLVKKVRTTVIDEKN